MIALTNYYEANLYTTSVSVTFQNGTLLTADGLTYNQLTGTFSLSDPSFLNSYYSVFHNNSSLYIEGIIFCSVSFVFLMMAVFFLKNTKLIAECMSFVMMVQVFGLSRIRDLPIDFQFYNVVKGYSYYEFEYIPNLFETILKKVGYSEVAIDSAVFVYGTQNLLYNFGSFIQIFILV